MNIFVFCVCSTTIARVRPLLRWVSYSDICTSELAAAPSVSYLICRRSICLCYSRNVIKRATIALKLEFYGRVGAADKSTMLLNEAAVY